MRQIVRAFERGTDWTLYHPGRLIFVCFLLFSALWVGTYLYERTYPCVTYEKKKVLRFCPVDINDGKNIACGTKEVQVCVERSF